MIYRFGPFALDARRRELLERGEARAVEPQVFDLLLLLVERRDRVVSRDELLEAVWAGRIVSDSALSSRIKDARAAIGDDGARQEWIRTVHGRGFRFVGIVAASPDETDASAQSDTAAPEQQIRYCRTGDGVTIAYARGGDGPPILKTATWMSHLEFDLESPIWRHWIAELSRGNTLVRYDERGNGLSDREVADLSFEAMVADLETVADASGLERFALLGLSQGCSVSAEYAVRHPERVSHLILYGGYARGWRARGEPVEIEQREATTALIRTGWGADNPAFRQIFTSRFLPGGTAEQMSWYNELQRKSVAANVAARLHEVFGDIDVESRLSQVSTPTLVLHARDDAMVSFAAGRELATGIPNARLATLDSPNHVLLEHEPAFARFVQEVRSFIAE